MKNANYNFDCQFVSLEKFKICSKQSNDIFFNWTQHNFFLIIWTINKINQRQEFIFLSNLDKLEWQTVILFVVKICLSVNLRSEKL